MGRLGFEPRTNRLKAECSTAELATRSVFWRRNQPFQARLRIVAQVAALNGANLKKNAILFLPAAGDDRPSPATTVALPV
jgi:hypothetical protein